jgi:hypothetical protein
MRALAAIAVVVLLAGCGDPVAQQQNFTLPSGRQVKVLGLVKILSSTAAPALMLKYQTDISLDDKEPLAKEIDEIWATFRNDVEDAHLSTGIVSAHEKPVGSIVTLSRASNVVYKRSIDGTWSRSDP